MVRPSIAVSLYFVCSTGLKKHREGTGVRDGNYVPAIAVWTKCLESIQPQGASIVLRCKRIGQAAGGRSAPSRPQRCEVAHFSLARWRLCPSSRWFLLPKHLEHLEWLSPTTAERSLLWPLHMQRLQNSRLDVFVSHKIYVTFCVSLARFYVLLSIVSL